MISRCNEYIFQVVKKLWLVTASQVSFHYSAARSILVNEEFSFDEQIHTSQLESNLRLVSQSPKFEAILGFIILRSFAVKWGKWKKVFPIKVCRRNELHARNFLFSMVEERQMKIVSLVPKEWIKWKRLFRLSHWIKFLILSSYKIN